MFSIGNMKVGVRLGLGFGLAGLLLCGGVGVWRTPASRPQAETRQSSANELPDHEPGDTA